jgi:Spy/CpxP family protein refolding chaperone
MRLLRHYRSGAIASLMTRRTGRRLRLDPQQQDKLTSLHSEIQLARSEIRQQRQSTRSDVKVLLTADTLDQQEALRLLRFSRDEMEDKLPELIASFAELFNSLNPQQHQRMQKMWQKSHRCSCGHPA